MKNQIKINIKLTSINLSFLIISILIFYKSILTSKISSNNISNDFEKDVIKTSLTEVRYFVKSNDGSKILVNAKEIELSDDERIDLDFSEGEIHTENDIVYYKAAAGKFLKEKNMVSLKGDVEIKFKDATLKCQKINFYLSANKLKAQDELSILVFNPKTKDTLNVAAGILESDLKGKIFKFSLNVEGNLERARKYESGFNFKGQKLIIDKENSKVSIEGSIEFLRSNYSLKAQRGEIFLENFNKELKYFVFYDDIRIEEKFFSEGQNKIVRQAFAEQLEGILTQRMFILSGAPKVRQNGIELKGYRIIMRENISQVEIEESHSRIEIQNSKKKKKK